MIHESNKTRLVIRAKSLLSLQIGAAKNKVWSDYRTRLAHACLLLSQERFEESAQALRIAVKQADNSAVRNTVRLIYKVLKDTEYQNPGWKMP